MRRNRVCLRKSSGRYALVFIHPASGSAASFRALQPHLGSDCSVYAFQAPGIDPDRPRSIEGIAQTYLAEFLAADSQSTPDLRRVVLQWTGRCGDGAPWRGAGASACRRDSPGQRDS
ncbi:thioesterase domain-containing protein [Streptomyces longwoodensis]|uniref:thioesterase domain-containing protein n=1 Tax=Streptomyces longwoodensis TaxID=68231 RepID=UPI0038502BDD